jgi:hypothetical protein
MTDRSTVSAIVLVALALSGFFIAMQQGWIPGFLLPNGSGTPTPKLSGGLTAYCSASANVTSTASPPNGCHNLPSTIVLNLLDLYTGKAQAAATFSCLFWTNSGNGWVVTGDVVKASVAPTTCTSNNNYPPGLQVGVSICQNQTPSCGPVDYGAQKTRIDCLLPAETATAVTGGLCGQNGLGKGTMPLADNCQGNTCKITFNVMFPVFAGSAYGNNSPDQIQISWQNGTLFTSSNTCFVLSGTKQCDLPIATSTGRLAVNVLIQTGAAGGTAPAAPYSAGYGTFTPFDPSLQANAGAGNSRGLLTLALVIEMKATTGTDVCYPGGIIGNAPVQVPNGSSGVTTDIFYVYPLSDGSLTRFVDTNGYVVQGGGFGASLAIDCSKVYNGSASDVVTLTFNVYAYFSLSYFQGRFGALNPEVPVNSNSGLATNNVITIKQ